MYIHPLFASVPETARKAVGDASALSSFRRNEVILESGQKTDTVYCVASGLVRVVSTGSSEESELTTNFLRPDDIHVGANITDSDSCVSEVRLVAALPSSLYLLPRRYLRTLCEHYPKVTLRLLEFKLRQIDDMRRQMRRVATLSAEQIITRALYDLARECKDGTRVLDKRIPQSVFASYAGLARQDVNKVFKDMEGRGLLERVDQTYVLSRAVGASTDFGDLEREEKKEELATPYAAADFHIMPVARLDEVQTG